MTNERAPEDDLSPLKFEATTANGEWAIFRHEGTGDITHIPTANYWRSMGFGHLFEQEVTVDGQ